MSMLRELQSAVGGKRAESEGFLRALMTEAGQLQLGRGRPSKGTPEAVFHQVCNTVRCLLKRFTT